MITVIGFIVSILIGFWIMTLTSSLTGIIAAVLVAVVLIILIVALSMSITRAYHTCLFLWARDVEDANLGAPGTVRPLAPSANARGV